jgi:lysophospholipase L1-like esterase
MKRILCFGDSNTWGRWPDRAGRYLPEERWAGILQTLLGADCSVTEDGMPGRTVNLDDPESDDKNGKTALKNVLETNEPFDVIIIMLGTNDLKKFFPSTPTSIALALSGLVDDITLHVEKVKSQRPEIVLVSPITIQPDAPRFHEFYADYFDDSAGPASKLFAEYIEVLCQERDLLFLNAAEHAEAGVDGLHFDTHSNEKLAHAIAATLA